MAIFAGLAPEVLANLAAISELVRLAPGQRVVDKAGERRLYVVLDGRLEAEEGESGSARRRFGPGELLDSPMTTASERWRASIRAVTAVTLAGASWAAVTSLGEPHPDLALRSPGEAMRRRSARCGSGERACRGSSRNVSSCCSARSIPRAREVQDEHGV